MSISVPSFQYMTPFLQNMFQTETLRFLQHLYTRERRVPLPDPPYENDWGQPEYTFPALIRELPCYFVTDSESLIQPYGIVSRDLPLLLVPPSDNLLAGDYISNVHTLPDPTTGNIVVLLPGPAVVEDISEPSPNYNGAIYRQARIRKIQMVPTDR